MDMINDNEELTELVNQVISLDAKLHLAEYNAQNTKKLLADLLEKEIPLKLQEMGLKEAVLKDGTKVSYVPTYWAKIKNENKAEAFTWLRNNGLGDLIKRRISIDFTKGDDNEASKVKSLLEEKGHLVDDKEDVNYQTLSAMVREQIEKGNDIPKDLLGVFQKKEAKIKRSTT